MQWSTKHCGLGKGCTCLLMFVLMPEFGLGEEAREGKEGRKGSRKEECHRFIKSRKVTQPLSVPSEWHVFVRSRHCVTWSYINATDMIISTHFCGWHGTTSIVQPTSLRDSPPPTSFAAFWYQMLQLPVVSGNWTQYALLFYCISWCL